MKIERKRPELIKPVQPAQPLRKELPPRTPEERVEISEEARKAIEEAAEKEKGK